MNSQLTAGQGARLGLAFKEAMEQYRFTERGTGVFVQEYPLKADDRKKFLADVLSIYDALCEAETMLTEQKVKP